MVWPSVDRLPVFDLEARAIDDMVAFFLAALFVHHRNQAGAVHGRSACRGLRTTFRSMKLHEAVVARFDLRLFGDARRRAADVERAHGELRARLADGLRGDDADRFAHFDHAAGRQVAAVAPARKPRAGTRRSTPSES